MSSILFINSKLDHENHKTISPPLSIAYLYDHLKTKEIGEHIDYVVSG